MEAETAGKGIGPATDRPRMFGGYLEPARLPWKWAVARLTEARNYWVATTRPDGRPHCRPIWGVWLDDVLYFSTGSLAAQNLVANPAITVHLESGNEVVILEGVADLPREPPLLEQVGRLYYEKYGWQVEMTNDPEPFYAVRPQVAFGWLSDPAGLDGGAAFHGTATRWCFGPAQSEAKEA